ncbi:hypothetical protein, partial [Citrobacter werkmanii]|uniref:hypothetical protein n=1 Tax=Citrobacter werkmanii TaxID=67827 RepID=UPI00254E16B2
MLISLRNGQDDNYGVVMRLMRFGRPDKAFTPHPAGFISYRRKKAHPSGWASSLYLMPGSSLLSHGETPHYHRRYGVS